MVVAAAVEQMPTTQLLELVDLPLEETGHHQGRGQQHHQLIEEAAAVEALRTIMAGMVLLV
jgi:hypothetical protein